MCPFVFTVLIFFTTISVLSSVSSLYYELSAALPSSDKEDCKSFCLQTIEKTVACNSLTLSCTRCEENTVPLSWLRLKRTFGLNWSTGAAAETKAGPS